MQQQIHNSELNLIRILIARCSSATNRAQGSSIERVPSALSASVVVSSADVQKADTMIVAATAGVPVTMQHALMYAIVNSYRLGEDKLPCAQEYLTGASIAEQNRTKFCLQR
jgi:hypothetical protein